MSIGMFNFANSGKFIEVLCLLAIIGLIIIRTIIISPIIANKHNWTNYN